MKTVFTPWLDNNSVDAIICDLPYFKVVKDEFDNQWSNEKAYLDWVNGIILQCYRILKPNWNRVE